MNKNIKINKAFLKEESSLEQRLETLGLGRNQIENYETVEELENSLERLNECLNEINPSPFTLSGVFYSKYINERKKLILDRICLLKGEQIKAVVDDTSERHSREEIKNEVDNLLSEIEETKKKSKEIDGEQKELELKIWLSQEEMRIKQRESISRTWLSFLEKESMASILGGFLLLSILIAQLVSLFQKLEVPDILNNSFLVILGYFFGQSTAKNSSDENQE